AAASQGYNYSTDASCNFTATGDVQSGADPLVGPLTNNGGLTSTRLPAATSPLLNRIPSGDCQDGIGTGVTTDQRGITRPQGVGCDVGAVEVAVIVPTPPGTPGTAPDAVVLAPRFTG
ncbi:MAG: choice-of-anchor Q domain-containing protein, partial [Acidimicrobiia bacterium]